MRPRCDWDTGSMYGNQPACDRPATVAITYGYGHYGPLTSQVCDRHRQAELGRIYPDPIRNITEL